MNNIFPNHPSNPHSLLSTRKLKRDIFFEITVRVASCQWIGTRLPLEGNWFAYETYPKNLFGMSGATCNPERNGCLCGDHKPS